MLESDLKTIGFGSRVPKREQIFIGGREDRIEDAPLGYYRYHFWINSDTAKPHENYVFIGKHVGFINVSLMQEKDRLFRMLFRSAMVNDNLNKLLSQFIGVEINHFGI